MKRMRGPVNCLPLRERLLESLQEKRQKEQETYKKPEKGSEQGTQDTGALKVPMESI